MRAAIPLTPGIRSISTGAEEQAQARRYVTAAGLEPEDVKMIAESPPPSDPALVPLWFACRLVA